MKDARKAVVLLSGGMDSCITAAIAREGHGEGNLALLHASYGQRTEKGGRQAFEKIADFWSGGERLGGQFGHFRAIGGSALTDRRFGGPGTERGAPGPQGGG